MNKYYIISVLFFSTLFTSYGQTLSGVISDSTSTAQGGHVYLYKFIATNKPLEVVDTFAINSADGSYFFENMGIGDFYVSAKGDTSIYPNHITTYFGQKPTWSGATSVRIDSLTADEMADILLIQIPNWSGSSNTGYCSGTIVMYDTQRAGDPVPGIDISLQQIPGGIIKANTSTNVDGFFEVAKIPNNTSYNLLVDIPGIPMDSTHTVQILAGDSAFNLDFIVDTSAANPGIFVANLSLSSVHEFVKKNYVSIEVYPNPSNSIFFINLPFDSSRITVYNLMGQPLFQENIYSNKARLDLSGQPKGAYILQVSRRDFEQTVKIILE
jgi:hypothetical protein